MQLALLRKNLRESWLLLAGCLAAMAAFCWVRVWIVAQIEMERFQTIVDNLPSFVQRLSPVPLDELISYAGRVAYTFEEPIVYLIMAVWSISRGSDSVSGEVARGTMEMLLGQPVSRLRVITHHAVVTLLGVVLLAGTAFFVTSVGVHTTYVTLSPEKPAGWQIPLLGIDIPWPSAPQEPRIVRMREVLDPVILLPATMNYASLGVFLTGMTMLLSAMDSYRWRTIGLAVGLYIVESLAEMLALAMQWDWMRRLTFFSAYEPVRFATAAEKNPAQAWMLVWQHDPLVLGPLGCDLILLSLGAAGLVAAAFIFLRRDLPAPI